MSPTNQRIAILANGDFPQIPYLELLACDGVVCCDCAHPQLKMIQIVGDLDTLSAQDRQTYAAIITDLSHDQETNDLTKAFRWTRRHYPEATIVLFGCTGKREDHTLANLSLLVDFAQEASVVLYTEAGTFHAVPPGGSLPTSPGQQVSIFSFNPQQAITSSGLKYPLKSLTLPRWWVATLNEATASSITLTASTPDLLLVYLNR